ncbi:MAG: hypoxanthine phosphoribosyltransferase [Candidatus Eremiobacteraeota bacterium]|nr:hypoxanthine phosphoribosyltransferase [Candidatus Eremiobacteraeota bacterium]
MIGGIVYDALTIERRVTELGGQIAHDYRGKNPLLIGILNSSAVFLADLSRAVPIPSEFDFIAVSKFASDKSVRFEKDTAASIEARHVLLVEDAIDTGLTLQYVMKTLKARAPASIEVCTLLDRPQHRIADIQVKYRGFEIPDDFLVGYGLDYKGRYRELPALYAHGSWPG